MLFPDFQFLRVTDIKSQLFKDYNIKTVLLDIDGTLVPQDYPTPPPLLYSWIEEVRESGVSIVLFSNNTRERVENFAKSLGLPFYYNAEKPKQKHFKKIKNTKKEGRFCIIGDRILTDVLGGNLAKIITILVNPVDTKDSPSYMKTLRKIEKPFRKAKGIRKGKLR